MAYEAKFLSGDPAMIDYTPSGAVAAGEIVLSSTKPFIAHNAIAANELGAVAAGGGTYEVTKVAGAAWTVGQVLYFNAAGNSVTHTDNSGANYKIGRAAKAAASGDTVGEIFHTLD